MNQPKRSADRWILSGVLLAAAGILTLGCEERIIRSEGIGASSSHPTTQEPAGSDPVSRKIFGEPKR